ncbi:MAG: class III lanthionine synthetase LanKC [Bacteroidota bacterium]
MNDNIEKRIFMLSPYVFSHPTYFLPLSEYSPNAQNYGKLLRSHMPENWELKRKNAWFVACPPQHASRREGFKIHISLLSITANEALTRIFPVLFQQQAKFKIAVDPKMHDFLNSPNCGKSSSGKFITIYPDSDAHFKEILEGLNAVTQGLKGPYILTDKPYRDSECLFYRYGAFRGNSEIDVFGQRQPTLIGKDEKVTDSRPPWFQLPPGIVDPFENEIEPNAVSDEATSGLLNGRYRVEKVLTNHSSKGGVYLAIDTQTDQKVVIKEARACINARRHSAKDARDGLRHEAAILHRLADTGLVPQVVALFREWQNDFLVLEYLPLPTTKDYGVWQNQHTVLQLDKSAEAREIFCRRYLTLLHNIVEAVEQIHQKGIVIGDLAPQNILFDEENLSVKMIDFEAAYDLENDAYYRKSYTPGFSHNHKGRPTFAHDYAALRGVAIHLIFPISKLFAFQQDIRPTYLRAMIRDEGLPQAFAQLIEQIGEDLLAAKRLIQILLSDLQAQLPTHFGKEHAPLENLQSVLQKIRQHIYDAKASAAQGTFFPADCRLYATNPLNVAYGAAGTCYFLHQSEGGLRPDLLEQFRRRVRELNPKHYPPGLYVGTAGIAWVCHQLGLREEARQLMAQTYRSPLLGDHADLFYGAAGWGMASLYFHQATGQSDYLDRALQAADLIRPQLQTDEHGLHFPDKNGHVFSGLMHGSSGIALFFLRLYEATQSPDHLRLARALLDHDLHRANEVDGQLQWQRNYAKTLWEPYMRLGNVGVGMVALRFYNLTKEASYLHWARRIADSITAQYTTQTGLFLGMSGIGSYFLDMYQVTGERKYLKEAEAFAHKILLHQVRVHQGIAFPGEGLLRLTNDYGTGSAGIGCFLQRLNQKGKGSPLFLDLESTLVRTPLPA